MLRAGRMKFIPVVERELRIASRKPWTFRLRLLFAGAGMAACLVVLLLPRMRPSEQSQAMLVVLGILGLIFCLLAGCFVTADSITSEKREATLGLLFLTPLRGHDIVGGEMACHSLQVCYGLLAFVPVFFLPLLLGGVTWGEAARILLTLLVCLTLSLAAGLFFSVVCSEAKHAALATLALVLLVSLLPVLWIVVLEGLLRIRTRPLGVPMLSPGVLLMFAFDEFHWRMGEGRAVYWGSAAMLACLSAVFLSLSGALLPRIGLRSSQGKASARETAREQQRRTRFAPRRLLEDNPFEWFMRRGLDEATWIRRFRYFLATICAIMLVGSLVTTHNEELAFAVAFGAAFTLHLVTKFLLVLDATRQIQADQRSGALELLLCTPLPERAFGTGYHRALRAAFRKPLLLLLATNLALQLSVVFFGRHLGMGGSEWAIFSSFFIGGLAVAAADLTVMRWVGLLHALQAATHLRAALLAFAQTMPPPWILFALTMASLAGLSVGKWSLAFSVTAWFGFCLVYDRALIHRTQRRLRERFERFGPELG
jgi:hypothetical protein